MPRRSPPSHPRFPPRWRRPPRGSRRTSCFARRGRPSTSATSPTRRAFWRCSKSTCPRRRSRSGRASVDNGVDELLMKRFPKLTIVKRRGSHGGVRGVRLPAARLRLRVRRAGRRRPLAREDRQAVRRLRHHADVRQPDDGRRAQRREVRLLPRFGLAAAREEARRATCPVMEFGPDAAFAVRPAQRRRGRRVPGSRAASRRASSSAASRDCATRRTG